MIFLALAPIVHTHAENYKIYGYVYLPDREPASFTTISVEGTSTGTTAREDGYYELKFSTTDSAKVKFYILGCKPYIYNITPKTRKSIQKMVYLEDDAIVMKDVEVTDFAKQSTSMNKIDVSKMDVMPSINGGIEGLISTYAGVSNRNELSSQYSVRGGNYDENSVYVNDIEVYRPLLIRTGEQEGLSFINPDMVEAVEFSAGGYGATYGDKMSSVLDIKYKKPKRFEASVAGSLLGAQGHIGHSTKSGKFTQLHGIRYKSSDYMFNTLDTKGTYDQKFLDYQTYLTFNFAKKWEIDFLGNFSRNIYNNIPESRTTTYGTISDVRTFRMYFDGQEKDIFQTEFGALTLRYSPINSLNLKLIASAYESHESVNYDLIGEYWIGESMGNSIGEIDESTALGVGAYQEYTRNRLRVRVIKAEHRGDYTINKNTISWGVSLQKEDIKDNIIEFETRDSSGYVTSTYNLRSNNSMSSWRTQFFVQDESRFKTRIGTFGLLAGVRGNYWTFNKEFIISQRATVSYFPKKNENLGFRFSTGVYYQSPFYKEVRMIETDAATGNSNVKLNDDIKSQRSLHFVLGGDYYFRLKGRPFKFTTEVYYKMADRVETYTINNLKILYSGTNDAQAYTAGVDFKLFGEFVPGTDSWIGLGLMRSKEKKNEPGAKWVARPNEQRYNFTMFFQDYIPGLPKYKVHLRFIWEDGLPFWAPNVETHSKSNTNIGKAYRRVDIGASRTFAEGDYKWLDKTKIFKAVKNINLGLEVFNLLDLSNVASYYWVTDVNKRQHAVPNYLTGRQFNVRLKINF